MKLFYGSGACSLGIHLLLEEIGRPYETVRLDTRAGDTKTPEFRAINPKAKVPALLRDDGMLLTEYPVIAHWLAQTNPAADLLPHTEDTRLVAAMTTDYIAATVHMQGFTRLFRPGNFTPNEADLDRVKARGTEIVEEGFAILDAQLGTKEWVAETYSYADSALFFVEWWGAKRMAMQLPPNLAAHYARMLARPATQRMFEQEGISA